jgi:hypothetical protein
MSKDDGTDEHILLPLYSHKMTTPKPLIITSWKCQKMMVLMSMELIGSVGVIW